MFPIPYSFNAFPRWVLLGAVIFLLSGIGALSHAKPYPIEGYPNGRSFTQGDVINFHISSKIERYHVTIQRNGANRETVWEGDMENANEHRIPEDASAQGCNWPVSFSVIVPADWKSGYYEVFFGAPDKNNKEQWIEGRTSFFVIRAKQPGSTADILLQLTTNTYNAYDNLGGGTVSIPSTVKRVDRQAKSLFYGQSRAVPGSGRFLSSSGLNVTVIA